VGFVHCDIRSVHTIKFKLKVRMYFYFMLLLCVRLDLVEIVEEASPDFTSRRTRKREERVLEISGCQLWPA
jgi:hypothetical protein